MISVSHDRQVLIFRGKSGPPYTASAECVMEIARKTLPANISKLRSLIGDSVSRIHIYHSDLEEAAMARYYDGDVKRDDIPDALSAIIVLAALETEASLLPQRGKTCSEKIAGRSRTWVCTLPAGHQSPEHVAHAAGYRDDRYVVCTRATVEENHE